MSAVKLYWQVATDDLVSGYYKVDSNGIRYHITEQEADELKKTMHAFRTYSNIMTPIGAIPTTIWKI